MRIPLHLKIYRCKDFVFYILYQFVIETFSLQQMCGLLEQCIESICLTGVNLKQDLDGFTSQFTRLESQQLIRGCQNATKVAQIIAAENTLETITHKVLILNK